MTGVPRDNRIAHGSLKRLGRLLWRRRLPFVVAACRESSRFRAAVTPRWILALVKAEPSRAESDHTMPHARIGLITVIRSRTTSRRIGNAALQMIRTAAIYAGL